MAIRKYNINKHINVSTLIVFIHNDLFKKHLCLYIKRKFKEISNESEEM